MLAPLESAAVTPLISNPGSAVPFSAPGALRVILGGASRTFPKVAFFAGSAAASSSRSGRFLATALFSGALAFASVPLTAVGRAMGGVAEAGSGAGAAGRFSEFVVLGLGAGLLMSGTGMLAGLLSAAVPIPPAETLGA